MKVEVLEMKENIVKIHYDEEVDYEYGMTVLANLFKELIEEYADKIDLPKAKNESELSA